MDDWKQIVADNLSALRKEQGLTQLQLAEQLHYSDKAVSKWERGESLPDLSVMKQLADFYGIMIDDFLLTPEQRAEKNALRLSADASADEVLKPDAAAEPVRKRRNMNRLIIAGMAAMLVWLIATLIFVVLDAVVPELEYTSFLFIYAAPVTAIVVLVFNSIWFNPRWNYAIISFLVWSVLAALFLTFYLSDILIWKLFLIGIPAQLIIILWSRLRPAERK
ncbi:MAG: helix-turn-helix domain-containing protein [Oscillospiraceae bacterium]|nr:helix-turn-helix domain-containing protein [Oscillospiraceae bacterium]